MARHRSSQSPTTPGFSNEENDLQNVNEVLRELRERDIRKEQEIEELNRHLKAAHVTINKLSDRMT